MMKTMSFRLNRWKTITATNHIHRAFSGGITLLSEYSGERVCLNTASTASAASLRRPFGLPPAQCALRHWMN